jgi:hypothetical protein
MRKSTFNRTSIHLYHHSSKQRKSRIHSDKQEEFDIYDQIKNAHDAYFKNMEEEEELFRLQFFFSKMLLGTSREHFLLYFQYTTLLYFFFILIKVPNSLLCKHFLTQNKKKTKKIKILTFQ